MKKLPAALMTAMLLPTAALATPQIFQNDYPGFLAAVGSVHTIDAKIAPAAIAALVTRPNGDVVPANSF